MSQATKRYFISAGNLDAVRGNVMPHLNTLPLWAQDAYKLGASFAKARVYVYRLTRSVGALKSGVTVTRLAKVPQDAKGKVSVMHDGVTLDLPVSRLVRVD